MGKVFKAINILLSIGTIEDKADFIDSVKDLQQMGYKIFATQGTHEFLKNSGLKRYFSA